MRKTLPVEEGCGVVCVCKHTASLFCRRIVTEQCNDSGRGGRNFFLPNDGAKWKAVLTEVGSTCGETDFMQFDQTHNKSECVSVSSLPFSLVLSHSFCLYMSLSLPAFCLPMLVPLFPCLSLNLMKKDSQQESYKLN